MASDENLRCPVCFDIFKDPVLLTCSHSFCKACLQSWWTEKERPECPMCKRRSSKTEPPRNLALKNLCDEHQRASTESGDLCGLHDQKLTLLCVDHEEMVCLICRDSEKHNEHKFRPLKEAAEDRKEELQKLLKPKQKMLNVYNETKRACDQMINHITDQAQNTERRIREEFKKLYQFLQSEEEARISALREEEQRKSQMIKETVEELVIETADLSATIREIGKELRTADFSFLKNWKATEERAKCTLPPDPQLPSGALVDVARHLGNLSFSIWDKMKETVSYCPVVVDPNTAGPELTLSEDLTSVRCGERQQLPENPERLKDSSVLGSRVLSSGSHCWDIEVGDSTCWRVGVVMESVWDRSKSLDGYWILELVDGKYETASPSKKKSVLQVQQKFQRIRLRLNLKKRKLSFSDADTDNIILTFRHSFTGRLIPFLSSYDDVPLRILPVKVPPSPLYLKNALVCLGT